MLKLMIVEDESLERKALSFLANKFYKDKITLVCEAANGRDAVNKALEFGPDIILMDINMPIMDGLKVSELIKAELPNIEIIILTAFSYFEYAKKAIQLGVGDYLLKPVTKEEFCNTMDKVSGRIFDRRNRDHKQRELKERLRGLVPFLEKEFIMEMIYSGKVTEKRVNEYKKLMEITGKYGVCMVFRTIQERDHDEQLLLYLKNKLKFMVSNVVGHFCLKDMIFLLFSDNLHDMIKSKNFKGLLQEIQYQVGDLFDLELSIGIGEVYENISDLYLSYNQGKKAVENYPNKIRYVTKEQAEISESVYPYEKENAICGRIINEDAEGALEDLDDILDYFIRHHGKWDYDIIHQYMKQLCLVLNRTLIQFYGSHFQPFDLISTEADIEQINDISKIREYMKNLFSEVILCISSLKTDRNIRFIEAVKNYMEENYMKDISLNDVADFIALSPYYLSKLFKKIENMNFKEYLIKIRMEKAKTLLRKEQKSIKETALEVGYVDPNYFSRAFKNYVGLSPKEYANL